VRSLYLPVVRDQLPHALEVFDFAEPSFVVSDREVTNVATQALFLMNDPEVMRNASAFAARVLARKGTDDAKVAFAFEVAFGRKPSGSEAAAARNFLAAFVNEPPRKDDPSRDNAPRRSRRGGRLAEIFGRGQPSAAAETEEPARAAWSALCQGLFQAAEFRYVD
jgi:hypothetical protein